MEEEPLLKTWFAEERFLISEEAWTGHSKITDHTAEHQVRYREADHSAIKRTWPGTFELISSRTDGKWKPVPASPGQDLMCQALQNELCGDQIFLEGAMIDPGPSIFIGHPPRALSSPRPPSIIGPEPRYEKRPAEAGRQTGDAIPGGADGKKHAIYP